MSVINTLQQQLQEALDRINVFLPTITNIQTQVTNNLNSINQLVNDLRNGNVIFGNAAIDTTQAYPKNYLGYVGTGQDKAWYLSQQAVPANTPIENTTYWVNVSEANTINVNLDNYYTKTESDTKFQTISGMSDYLTVANANSTFATKTQLGNYYTKTESDTSFLKTRKNNFTYDEKNSTQYTYIRQALVNSGHAQEKGILKLSYTYDTNTLNSLIIQPMSGNAPTMIYTGNGGRVTILNVEITPLYNPDTGATKQFKLEITAFYDTGVYLFGISVYKISAFGVEAIQIEN